MRGLMRMLMMFGPMIFRQFQKYQRNKQRQQPTQQANRQIGRGQEQSNRQPRHDRGEQVEYKDLNAELEVKKQGRTSAEERDFKLKEDEIMLDKSDLRHYDKNDATTHSKQAIEKAVDEKIEMLQGPAKEQAMKVKKDALENDLDLRKLFLD